MLEINDSYLHKPQSINRYRDDTVGSTLFKDRTEMKRLNTLNAMRYINGTEIGIQEGYDGAAFTHHLHPQYHGRLNTS